jgi:hypothetical protein
MNEVDESPMADQAAASTTAQTLALQAKTIAQALALQANVRSSQAFRLVTTRCRIDFPPNVAQKLAPILTQHGVERPRHSLVVNDVERRGRPRPGGQEWGTRSVQMHEYHAASACRREPPAAHPGFGARNGADGTGP